MHGRVTRAAGIVCLLMSMAARASGQNVTVVQSSAPESSTTKRTLGAVPPEAQVAVPVAASSDLGTGDAKKGVAPTVGFQIWKKDRFFLGSFFSIAAADTTISEKYGSFLLNPPMQGRSFYVAGNCTLYPAPCTKPSAPDSPILLGIGGRWGTTGSDIQHTPTGGTAATRNAFVSYASLTFQVVSKTMAMELKDTTSEFQIGFEMGPTWRLVGGDFGEDDALRKDVLGTTKSAFRGFEGTFFLRLNSVQPFARFSTFGRPDGVVIDGFTGRQIVWGVNVASALFQSAVK